mmetsp:Transcript_64154/g.153213  ORF Transcript_64154/g.153213 Transcript_64154/m.153213 type:complete len:227 (+) Transcript_64154:39-719(+)
MAMFLPSFAQGVVVCTRAAPAYPVRHRGPALGPERGRVAGAACAAGCCYLRVSGQRSRRCKGSEASEKPPSGKEVQKEASGTASDTELDVNDMTEEECTDYVLAFARELIGMVPIAGPLANALEAAEKGDTEHSMLNFMWLVADVATFGLDQEAKIATQAAEQAMRLAKLGQKGVQIERLAQAARSAQNMKEIGGEVRMALLIVEKSFRAYDRVADHEKPLVAAKK